MLRNRVLENALRRQMDCVEPASQSIHQVIGDLALGDHGTPLKTESHWQLEIIL